MSSLLSICARCVSIRNKFLCIARVYFHDYRSYLLPIFFHVAEPSLTTPRLADDDVTDDDVDFVAASHAEHAARDPDELPQQCNLPSCKDALDEVFMRGVSPCGEFG